MKNNQKRTKIAVFAFFIAAAFFLVGAKISSAQQEPPKKAGSAMVLANVNMRDAKIEKQEKNVLTISFNISNDFDKIQPGILVRASLQKNENDSRTVLDEKIIGSEFTLEPKEKGHREITYAVPDFIQGKYEIWLNAQTAGGLPLSTVRAGETTFSGTNDYVEIVNNSCYLIVKGEIGEKKYTLLQGVDIEKNENLQAVCDLMNHSDQPRKFSAELQTFQRNTFGTLLETSQKNDASFVLRAKEKKQFTIDLPKANDPQAYDIKLTLQENKKTISNSAVFHYVLRGASATIQSLQIDKQSYINGETAKASLIITGSADNFPDSRHGTGTDLKGTSLAVKIQSGQTLCGQIQKNPQLNGMPDSIEIAMTENCPEPAASVVLKDSAGNILSQRDFFVGKNSQAEMEKATQLQVNEKSGKRSTDILIIVIAVLVIFLAVYVLWKLKKKSSTIVLMLFLGLGLAISFHMASPAKAVTLGWIDLVDGMSTPYAVGDIDKSEYYPGETITASGWATGYAPCGNMGISWLPYDFRVEINGASYPLYGSDYSSMRDLKYANGTAQSSLGDYCATFKLEAFLETGPLYGYECYTVKAPVNGSCGAANGTESCSAPSSSLCSAGSPSAVSDGGTSWSWSCAGSPGGSAVSCTAGKSKIDGRCTTTINTCDPGAVINPFENDAGWGWSCNASCNGETPDCFVDKVPTPGRCGSANGDPPACSKPTAPAELCADSTIPSAVNWSESTEQWEWTCGGINGSTVTSPLCIEKKVVPAECGSESNAFRCPGFPIPENLSQLCLKSSSHLITPGRGVVTALLPAAWTCKNSCEVPVSCTNHIQEKEDGECGSADGKTICDNSHPTLCEDPETASIDYPDWGSMYDVSWTCAGSCEGSTASCSAKGTKSCGWIEANP